MDTVQMHFDENRFSNETVIGHRLFVADVKMYYQYFNHLWFFYFAEHIYASVEDVSH